MTSCRSSSAHPNAATAFPHGQPHEELVGTVELARRLGVHERTIRRMVHRGELPRPCVGNGGRPRWLWGYVLDYCRQLHERSAKIDRKVRRELK